MKERDCSLNTLQQLFATVSHLFPRFPCILLNKIYVETCGCYLQRRLETSTPFHTHGGNSLLNTVDGLEIWHHASRWVDVPWVETNAPQGQLARILSSAA